MRIGALTLHTRVPDAQWAFYDRVLGFPVQAEGEETTTFGVGWTRLTFRQDAELGGPYHLAFNVPADRFDRARDWLEERVALLPGETGETTFHSEGWDADMVYFRDADGNILEFIARHTLPAPPGSGFGVRDVLAVSELGVAVPDVPAAVRDLQERFGLPVYGEASPTFTPLGDEEGLLIVVPIGRGWFPVGEPARRLPFHLQGHTDGGPLDLKEQA